MKGPFTIAMVHQITLLVTLLIHGSVTVRAQTVNKTALRIVVPPKTGFNQFVNISQDAVTGKRNFSGFAIEVFNQAVSAAVDKSFSFEFIPFVKPDGSMNGTYDDMVKAVFNKDYDGAVGDITIRFTRTQWVDFTAPYTDIGMSMLIPVRHQSSNDSPNSLISLTRKIVIATIVFFFFSIVVFCAVDFADWCCGRTRDDLKDPVESEARWKKEMLGTAKGTRMMVLIWFIILMFLITYYATALMSLLSKEDSSPPTRSLNQIIRTGEKVGYYKGGFSYDVLKEFGLSEAQLVPYSSEAQLLSMLTKGSDEGGITVAIDETPPLSVFLAQHCSDYTLVPIPNLQISGYGFAFSIGSDLVQQVSKGIIKITDNGQLRRIRARTIGDTGACDVEPSIEMVSDIASPSLVHTFVACGVASVLLFVIAYIVYGVTTNRGCLQQLFH